MKLCLASILIGGILCTNVNKIYGQTPEEKIIFTLKDCMEYAVSNSTEIRILQADNNDNQIARRDAILSAFTPSISGNAYLYSNFGRAVDPETNTYISTTSLNNAYSLGASIDLFNGFEAVNNLKITKTAKAMGLSEEQQAKDRICLATMEAYYNVVYYKQLTDILKDQTETARNALHLAKRQEELGIKGYADVVQMDAELADKEYLLVTAQNNLDNALITLKDVMFYPIGEDILIDCDINPEDEYGDTIGNSYDTGEIIENAMHSLPAISIARGKMENARLELRTAKWQLSPSLTLSGGWSTSYYTYPGQAGYVPSPFWNQINNNGGEYVQLTLNIPIFNRLSRHSNIARKKNEFTRATAEYEKKTREIEAEVMRAVQDRNGASSAFLQADRRAEVQKEAFRLNSKKFEQGLVSPIEYQTASGTYLNAEAERLNALLQFCLKKHVVAYYNGLSYINQF